MVINPLRENSLSGINTNNLKLPSIKRVERIRQYEFTHLPLKFRINSSPMLVWITKKSIAIDERVLRDLLLFEAQILGQFLIAGKDSDQSLYKGILASSLLSAEHKLLLAMQSNHNVLILLSIDQVKWGKGKPIPILSKMLRIKWISRNVHLEQQDSSSQFQFIMFIADNVWT